MPQASRIRVLPEALANQIAAGEVVQRPASALKELVENSLDAGARRVQVELEGGGARLIRVRDDGSGMGRDDALLAFERHATSKIASEADLHRVATLGFRGEALPSIAAVSRVTLLTRPPGETLGTEVTIEGGRVQRVTEMGAPEGTLVEARSLFFNVPARRKFLRRPETELARCVEVASRAAMAHSEVAFILRHGGKVILDLRAGEERLSRAASLLGKEAARAGPPAAGRSLWSVVLRGPALRTTAAGTRSGSSQTKRRPRTQSQWPPGAMAASSAWAEERAGLTPRRQPRAGRSWPAHTRPACLPRLGPESARPRARSRG